MLSCCTLLFPGISIPSPPPVSRIPQSGHACPVGSPCSRVCIMWLDERVGCSHTPPPLHTYTHHPCLQYQLVSTCTCMSCSGDSPGNVQHPGGELILTDYLHTSPTKNYFFPLIRAPPITVLPDHARPVLLHSLTACQRYLTHPYRTCASPCPTCHSIVSSVPCSHPSKCSSSLSCCQSCFPSNR